MMPINKGFLIILHLVRQLMFRDLGSGCTLASALLGKAS